MAGYQTFIEEVRTWPKFAEAARNDVLWLAYLNDIERGLEFFSRADDARAIELFDRLSAIINDEGRELKPRLLDVVAVISGSLHSNHSVN
jgi:hypothetical protein